MLPFSIIIQYTEYSQNQNPNLDVAYTIIRREIARQGIMVGDSSLRQGLSEIWSGLVAYCWSETSCQTHLKYSHCGGSRHSKEGCFKLIGYPDWWEETKQRKTATKVPVSQTDSKVNHTTIISDDKELLMNKLVMVRRHCPVMWGIIMVNQKN